MIIDLGGVDAMFGRDGADHFVLSADGQIDFIKDFQDGLDLIDIGRWEGAEFEDLSLRAIKTGKVLVTYGNEELVVQDVARTLTVQDLTTEDFTADPTAGIFQ